MPDGQQGKSPCTWFLKPIMDHPTCRACMSVDDTFSVSQRPSADLLLAAVNRLAVGGLNEDGRAWAADIRPAEESYARTVVADAGCIGVCRALLKPITRVTEALCRLNAFLALDTCGS